MDASLSPSCLADVALFRNEWSVLLECASPSRDFQRLQRVLRSADWTRLLVLTEEHGVTALLTACLHDLSQDTIPPEVRQTLLERQRAQIFFSLRLIAELYLILERFASLGIGALAVKGPVLALRAYGDPGMRRYSDLDLLVRQKDMRRATELMTAAGYQPKVSLRSIDAGKLPGQYLFFQPDSRLLVELHNDFTLRYFPRRLPLEEFFRRQTPVRLDAHDVPALSVEDELVLVCIHGAKHLWERLMWIADIAALVSRQTGIDWDRAAESAQEVGAERMLHAGLLLAADLLDARLPEKISLMARADAAAARLVKQSLQWLPAAGHAPPGILERAAFRMRMRGGVISAPAYLLRLSFSPTEEDWRVGANAEVKRHGLLNAVRRPFRLVRKYGRGNRV